jgi:ABC-2 type transport system ATP-binding protein
MTENVIEIRNLSRSFGRQRALDDVSLALARGTVFGLVGENGAGKTTLLRHVLGLLVPDDGRVRVFGLDPVAEPVEVLRRIGYLSEDRDQPEWMRVGQLLSYTAAFFRDWDHAFERELTDTFELTRTQRVRSLSRGQRARLGLVLAVAHRPELLLLDEPSSGLDPVVRRDILGAIVRTVADEGRTVLFSSHLLDEVQRVSDHVAMLHAGKVVLDAPLDDVLVGHHRLVVRFESPPQRAPLLPGALSCVGEGRDWTFVANGAREELERRVVELKGEVVERGRPSLEEILVARIREAHTAAGAASATTREDAR